MIMAMLIDSKTQERANYNVLNEVQKVFNFIISVKLVDSSFSYPRKV